MEESKVAPSVTAPSEKLNYKPPDFVSEAAIQGSRYGEIPNRGVAVAGPGTNTEFTIPLGVNNALDPAYLQLTGVLKFTGPTGSTDTYPDAKLGASGAYVDTTSTVATVKHPFAILELGTQGLIKALKVTGATGRPILEETNYRELSKLFLTTRYHEMWPTKDDARDELVPPDLDPSFDISTTGGGGVHGVNTESQSYTIGTSGAATDSPFVGPFLKPWVQTYERFQRDTPDDERKVVIRFHLGYLLATHAKILPPGIGAITIRITWAQPEDCMCVMTTNQVGMRSAGTARVAGNRWIGAPGARASYSISDMKIRTKTWQLGPQVLDPLNSKINGDKLPLFTMNHNVWKYQIDEKNQNAPTDITLPFAAANVTSVLFYIEPTTQNSLSNRFRQVRKGLKSFRLWHANIPMHDYPIVTTETTCRKFAVEAVRATTRKKYFEPNLKGERYFSHYHRMQDLSFAAFNQTDANGVGAYHNQAPNRVILGTSFLHVKTSEMTGRTADSSQPVRLTMEWDRSTGDVTALDSLECRDRSAQLVVVASYTGIVFIGPNNEAIMKY